MTSSRASVLTPREVLGVFVEPNPFPETNEGAWRTRTIDGETLGHGTLPHCERIRLHHLTETFGRGKVNVRLPTMGGKQLWADVFVSCGWRIQEGVIDEHHRLLDPQDRRVSWGTFQECRVSFESQRLSLGLRPRSGHALVLLHGLIRAKEAMEPLSDAFTSAGYEVLNLNYPSTRRPIDAHADQLDLLLNQIWGVDTISFVTHSLGGIVVRAALAREAQWHRWIKVDRLLMIFPPSQGSELALKWSDNPLARAIWGPPLSELAPQGQSLPPAPDHRFAIIAGARDRTVGLEEARLSGAEAFHVMDVEHTFGMRDPEVIATALRYIDGGPLQPE